MKSTSSIAAGILYDMPRNELGRKYYSLNLDTVVLFETNRPLDNRRYFYPVPIALSHGLFMIFTISLNSIYAIISSGREMQELSFLNYPFGELHDFARYPHGLSGGFSAAVYSPPHGINSPGAALIPPARY